MAEILPIVSLVSEEYQEVVTSQLLELLEEVADGSWRIQAQENLKYLSSQPKLVKTIPEIWKSNDGLSATGFKVNSFRGDDEVYQQHPELQEMLPRGLVYVSDPKNGIKNELTIFSFPKFFGLRNGDDDDNDMTQEIQESVVKFLPTIKANGEMAQIFWYAPRQSWIIGSKNRKILCQSSTDIEPYQKDQCYSFSVLIAIEFFKLLNRIPPSKLKQLTDFLETSRLTMIFELENMTSQHVVPLRENRLVLIAFTSILTPKGLHPAFTHAMSCFMGASPDSPIPCVVKQTKSYEISKLNQITQKVSEAWETEGAVFYLMDDQSRVIQMIKVKSEWYVILRAIREKIRTHLKTGAVLFCQSQTQNRLSNLNKDQGVSMEIIEPFRPLANAFINWFFANHRKLPDLFSQRFTEQYPSLWHDFLNEYQLPLDNSLLKYPNLKAHLKQNDHLNDPAPTPALLVFFQGIPGIGKNYAANQLNQILIDEGTRSEVVDQDTFAEKVGYEKSGEACFNYIQQRIFSSEVDVILFARNNSNRRQYKRYLVFPRYVFIAPTEAVTQQSEMLAMCIASVLQRQSSTTEKHGTDSMSPTALASLPFKFMAEYSPFPMAFQVNFLKIGAQLDPSVSEQLLQELQRFHKNGFSTKDISEEFLKSLDLVTPLTFRRPIQELLSELLEIIRNALVNSIPVETQYIGVELNPDDRTKLLLPIISSYPGTDIAHHITLMHSNQYHQNQARWQEISCLIDLSVTATITRLKHQKGKLTAAEVTLDPSFLNQLVFSGLPHITLKLESKTRAFESTDVLADESIPWIDLKSPIVVSGKVSMMK